MSDKKCPRCGLWSTGSALLCDCGYNFAIDTSEYQSQSKDEVSFLTWQTFMKSAVISLVVGMLGASLVVGFMDMMFGVDVAINSFFKVMPRSFFIGGLPSIVLSGIVWPFEIFGKSEKGMYLTSLIISAIIGALCGFPLYISYGV